MMRLCSHEPFFYNISGSSDQDSRDVFEKASRTVPTIVFINHIDIFGFMEDDVMIKR